MASEEVGSLVARVVADTQSFRTEMVRAAQQLESNTGRMNRALASLNAGMDGVRRGVSIANRALGVFGVSLSARYFASWIKNAVMATDAQIRQTEELQRARTAVLSLSTAWNDLGRAVGTQAAPAISGIARSLSDLAVIIGGDDLAKTEKGIRDLDERIAIHTEYLKTQGREEDHLIELWRTQRAELELLRKKYAEADEARKAATTFTFTKLDENGLNAQLAKLGHDTGSLLIRPKIELEELGAAPMSARTLNDLLRQQGMMTTGMQRMGGAEGLGGTSADAANEAFRKNEEELTQFIFEQHFKRAQIVADFARQRAESEQIVAEQTREWQQFTFDSAASLLRTLGAEHRGAAIAAIALEKTIAIQRVLIQGKTAAASILALGKQAAWQALAQLGPIAGPPVAAAMYAKSAADAASVKALSAVSAGMIGFEGLMQAAQVSSDGMQSALGTAANPLVTQSNSPAAVREIERHSQKVMEVHLHGGVWTSRTIRELMSEMKKEMQDYDVVLFNADSKQAHELTRLLPHR